MSQTTESDFPDLANSTIEASMHMHSFMTFLSSYMAGMSECGTQSRDLTRCLSAQCSTANELGKLCVCVWKLCMCKAWTHMCSFMTFLSSNMSMNMFGKVLQFCWCGIIFLVGITMDQWKNYSNCHFEKSFEESDRWKQNSGCILIQKWPTIFPMVIV